ncbi:hypothetical protein T484DRAFT_1803543 [Baffinella frigidus]|nr:hypothetical protein T484DRAFT_1803543 [Cryptophyta sp. CCMP2293]
MARFSVILLVIVAAPASALVMPPLAGHASPAALLLRGGLGDVDPTMVAKVATGLGSANALFVALAPKQAAEAYGVKVSGALRWLLEYNGHMLVASAILSGMTLAGFKLRNAVAWSCVPYAVFVLQGILQGRAGKHGVNVAGQFLLLAINAFMMHTCWTNAK